MPISLNNYISSTLVMIDSCDIHYILRFWKICLMIRSGVSWILNEFWNTNFAYRANTRNIVQYDLLTKKIVREGYPFPSLIQIVPRKYSYEWGGYTQFDFSVDESGLWILYSYPVYKGKLCASLLDPLTLRAIHTYCAGTGISSEPMTSMGNAFVACGIVYSIDSYNVRKTTHQLRFRHCYQHRNQP